MKAAPYNGVGVKRAVLARILQTEIDRRGGLAPRLLSQYHRGGYAASLADEIAASGQMGLNAARRRVYSILNPHYIGRNGQDVEQYVVNIDTADKILTALDLNYLWHTDAELADSIVEPERTTPKRPAARPRKIRPCVGCGGSLDVFDPECRTCASRKCWRETRAAKRALVSRPGLGGLSGDREISPPRGGTSKGTNLRRAA